MCRRYGWSLEYVEAMDLDKAYRLISAGTNADNAHADNARYRRG